ncbi:hypothetical protein RRG08_062246, partial [Elysia crispata]
PGLKVTVTATPGLAPSRSSATGCDVPSSCPIPCSAFCRKAFFTRFI